ncbi:MAG: hypothetical protein PHI39_00560 [Kiritimatiellae bacterium]|nr:hypothetical protein [Kiritimatiellia bacterium]
METAENRAKPEAGGGNCERLENAKKGEKPRRRRNSQPRMKRMTRIRKRSEEASNNRGNCERREEREKEDRKNGGQNSQLRMKRITQRGKAATNLIRTHELMKMERGISRKTGNARKQDRLRAIPEMN